MTRATVEIYWAFKGKTKSFFKEMPVLNPMNFCLPSCSHFIKANRTELYWGNIQPDTDLQAQIQNNYPKCACVYVCVCV